MFNKSTSVCLLFSLTMVYLSACPTQWSYHVRLSVCLPLLVVQYVNLFVGLVYLCMHCVCMCVYREMMLISIIVCHAGHYSMWKVIHICKQKILSPNLTTSHVEFILKSPPPPNWCLQRLQDFPSSLPLLTPTLLFISCVANPLLQI